MKKFLPDENKKIKFVYFRYRPWSKKAKYNKEHEQDNREKQLDRMITLAKEIALKYLCAIDTYEEKDIPEYIGHNELMELRMNDVIYPESNNIVELAGVMVYTLRNMILFNKEKIKGEK